MRDIPGNQILVSLAAECCAISVSVVHHLFFRPVQHLAESVQILKTCHVSDNRHALPLVIIFKELEAGIAGHRVAAFVLALLYDLNIDALVLTAAQCQLNVSLISQHELRILYAFFLLLKGTR